MDQINTTGLEAGADCGCDRKKINDVNAVTEPVRVAIIDDDAASVEALVNALEVFEPKVSICGTARNLEGARRLIRGELPTLIFLDIEFPDEEESGLDLLDFKSRLGCDIDVVFYTSYRKYLIQALRMQAFDFLLKPIDPDELSIIMNRYFMEREKPDPHPQIMTMNALGMQQRYNAKALAITTVTNDKVIVLPSSIIFFKYDSDRKLWEVVLNTLQRFILKRHTTADVILEYGSEFVRTHKAYIVNVAYLGMITANSCTLLPPYNDITEIKISKNFRRQLLDRFYDL